MKTYTSLVKYLFASIIMLILSSCTEKVHEVSKPLYELKTNNTIPKFDSENA